MIPHISSDLLAGTWEFIEAVDGNSCSLILDREAGTGRGNTFTKPAAFLAGSHANQTVSP